MAEPLRGPALVFVGDLHARHKSPVGRKDDYFETLLRKLDHVRKAAVTVDAEAVVFSGDIFHDKSSVCPHALVADMIDVFSKFPCPVVSVPGNHDLPYHSMDQLSSSPFYVLLKAGVIELATLESPYITHSGEVAVYGWAYSKSPSLDELKAMKPTEATVKVLVVHNFVSKFGGDFFGSRVFSLNELADALPFPVHATLVGHFHDPEELVVTDGLACGAYIRPGAVMRGSLVDEEVNRTPHIYAARFSTEAGEGYEEVNGVYVRIAKSVLPHLPPEEVFYLEERAEAQRMAVQVEEFVSSLDDLADTTSGVEGEINLEEFDIPFRVKELARTFLHEAESRLS